MTAAFSFDFTFANIKLRSANNKIVIVFKEDNDHITVHFRDNFELLDIHRKNHRTGKYQHLYVSKINNLISTLTEIEFELYRIILKYLQYATYEELKKKNFWLQYNSYISSDDYFENKKNDWATFENDFVGRSIQLPVRQMKKSIHENTERVYQVFKEGETTPIGVLFQKATSFDNPMHFFINFQDLNNILKEVQKLIPHFSKLHDPEEQRRLEEKYEK